MIHDVRLFDDGWVIENTRTEELPSGASQFVVILPSGRELRSAPATVMELRQCMIAWAGAVRSQIEVDNDEAKAAARRKQSEQERAAIQPASQSICAVAGELPASADVAAESMSPTELLTALREQSLIRHAAARDRLQAARDEHAKGVRELDALTAALAAATEAMEKQDGP